MMVRVAVSGLSCFDAQSDTSFAHCCQLLGNSLSSSPSWTVRRGMRPGR